MQGFVDLLERNQAFAASGKHQHLGMRPNFPVVVVGCLDPRVEPAETLGLGLGDAMVLRNVGGRITRGVLEDLAFISMAMEAAIPEGPLFEVAIVHHTHCGATSLQSDPVREGYAARIGADERAFRDYANDPETTVTTDVARVVHAMSISDRVRVSGHVYDMDTGLIRTVTPATSRAVQAAAAE